MPRCPRSLRSDRLSLPPSAHADRTTVIYVGVDPARGVPGFESWWDVVVAEVSEQPAVRAARTQWEEHRKRERHFL